MRNRLFAVAVLAFTALALPVPATAAPGNPCDVEGWFVNPDEADREPERTTAGFVFEGADLIHHAAPAGLTTATLNSGDYTASPAPDQPSFFSVEVSGTDGGYATLRYNRSTHLWEMTTGGQLYENTDPDKLVDMPPVKRSHTVVSFGVGYTKNPPGTVKTTVKSVSFQGKAYTLSCLTPTTSPTATTSASPSRTASASPTSPSPSASASGTSSVSPSNSTTTTASPSASRSSGTPSAPLPGDNTSSDGELPVTGAGLIGLVSAGVFLAAVGGIIVIVARRRRSA